MTVGKPLVFAVTGPFGVNKQDLLNKFSNNPCIISSNNVVVFYCASDNIYQYTDCHIRTAGGVVNFLKTNSSSPLFRHMYIYNNLIEQYDNVQNIVSQMTGKDCSVHRTDAITIQPIILLDNSLHIAHNIYTKMELEMGRINLEEFQLLQYSYINSKKHYNVDHTFWLYTHEDVCFSKCKSNSTFTSEDIYKAYRIYGPKEDSFSDTIIESTEKAWSSSTQYLFEVLHAEIIKRVKQDCFYLTTLNECTMYAVPCSSTMTTLPDKPLNIFEPPVKRTKLDSFEHTTINTSDDHDDGDRDTVILEDDPPPENSLKEHGSLVTSLAAFIGELDAVGNNRLRRLALKKLNLKNICSYLQTDNFQEDTKSLPEQK